MSQNQCEGQWFGTDLSEEEMNNAIRTWQEQWPPRERHSIEYLMQTIYEWKIDCAKMELSLTRWNRLWDILHRQTGCRPTEELRKRWLIRNLDDDQMKERFKTFEGTVAQLESNLKDCKKGSHIPP